MDKFEALWAYQTEDIKADAIANEIRRSPIRQKLEKSRDFIMDRQKQYKQIEDSIAGITDRKDVLEQALDRAVRQLESLKEQMTGVDPEDENAVETLRKDVSKQLENQGYYRDRIRIDHGNARRIAGEKVAVHAADAQPL